MKKEVRSLTPEDLAELEQFAELQFSLESLATLMQLDYALLRVEFHRPNSAVGDAINRGRLKNQAAIRAAIIKSAIDGSSPAQTAAVELIKIMEAKDAT